MKKKNREEEEKRKLFAQHQESTRKDVGTFKHIIYGCIILHNMIVEDKQHI